jgi:hypothetical protein
MPWPYEPVLMPLLVWVHKTSGAKAPGGSFKRKPFFSTSARCLPRLYFAAPDHLLCCTHPRVSSSSATPTAALAFISGAPDWPSRVLARFAPRPSASARPQGSDRRLYFDTATGFLAPHRSPEPCLALRSSSDCTSSAHVRSSVPDATPSPQALQAHMLAHVFPHPARALCKVDALKLPLSCTSRSSFVLSDQRSVFR